MSLAEILGVLRSLATYYAVPFRAARLSRLYSQFVQPGDLCFDIGAHVGNRVRALLRLGARVVAVEPNPIFADLLRRWFPGVIVVNQAAGARTGSGRLLVSSRTPTVSTLSRDWARKVSEVQSFSRVEWDTRLPVEVTTLDALIEAHGLPVFCKLDVEGLEEEVLKGLSRPLGLLSFEYLPATIEVAVGCIARLDTLGSYAFNWTIGERAGFEADVWLEAKEMVRGLQALPREHRSGDVYARRLDA